mgnify:FL=1
MKLLIAWAAILLLVVFLGGVGLGRVLWGGNAPPKAVEAPETCVIGVGGLPGPYGGLVAIFGETELCFREMRWSSVYGPTMPEGEGRDTR